MLAKIAKAFALLTVVSTSIVAVGCAAPTATMQEEEGETGSFLLAGPVLSAATVATHVRNAGFPENMVGKMVCTAKWESSFYQKAKNGSHYGLFQISKLHLGKTSGCVGTVDGIYSPANNAKCAFGVYKAQGLGAWEAYKSHKSECDRYKAPGSVAVASAEDDADSDLPANVPVPTPRPSDSDLGISDSGDEMTGGGCFSASFNTMTEQGACVQSSITGDTGVWFQCNQGKWYRGGNSTQGPFGACTSVRSQTGNTGDFAFASVNVNAD